MQGLQLNMCSCSNCRLLAGTKAHLYTQALLLAHQGTPAAWCIHGGPCITDMYRERQLHTEELQCPAHNVSATSSWEVSINYCAPFRSTLVSGSAVMRYCLRFLSCRHQSGRYSTVIYCNKPYTAHKRDSTFPGKASQRMQQDPAALLAPLLPLLPLQHNARRPTCSRCMPTGYTCCNPARCQQTAAGHCPNNICHHAFSASPVQTGSSCRHHCCIPMPPPVSRVYV